MPTTHVDFRTRSRIQRDFIECEVVVPIADIRVDPKPTAKLETQRLLGQRLQVKGVGSERTWLPCRTHYGAGGYVLSAEITPTLTVPSHRVHRTTHVYLTREADTASLGILHPGSRVRVAAGSDVFVEFGDGWLLREDLAYIGRSGKSPERVVTELVGTRYLWGGVTSHGIDCSGLLIRAFDEVGIDLPHSAAQIAQVLAGQRFEPTEKNLAQVRMGDVICWPDHIGLMVERTTIGHATAFNRCVLIEPLKRTLERREREGEKPLSMIIRPSYYVR